MPKYLNILILSIVASIAFYSPAHAGKTGIPFMNSWQASEYRAHERNFDVDCDSLGNIFFANFQGILHFDQSRWQLYVTPDISRVTAVKVTGNGRLYVGGYETLGRLEPSPSGGLIYKSIACDPSLSKTPCGEILAILPYDGKWVFAGEKSISIVEQDSVVLRIAVPLSIIRNAFLYKGIPSFQTEDNNLYSISGSGLESITLPGIPKDEKITCSLNLPDGREAIGTNHGIQILNSPGQSHRAHLLASESILQMLALSDGSFVASTTNGIFHIGQNLGTICHITEESGLCNNTINGLCSDQKANLWCAGAQGISAISIPSWLSHFTPSEGLQGEVLCITRHKEILYAGSYNGLFYLDESTGQFRHYKDIPLSCWDLKTTSKGELLAATASGLFSIDGPKCHRYSDAFFMSLLPLENGEWLSGQVDGLYLISSLVPYRQQKISDLLQISHIYRGPSAIFLENVFGQIYKFNPATKAIEAWDQKHSQGNSIFESSGNLWVSGRNGILALDVKDSAQTPQISAPDGDDGSWWPGKVLSVSGNTFLVTAGDGTGLRLCCPDSSSTLPSQAFNALSHYSVRLMFADGDRFCWIGGGFGLVCIDASGNDQLASAPLVVDLRAVQSPDSLLWNGFSLYQPRLPSSLRQLEFHFGSRTANTIKPVQYSFLLKPYDGDWSEWGPSTVASYRKLPYRKFSFYVKAMDAYGRESAPALLHFSINKPFYLKWYSIIIYILLFGSAIYLFLRWRTLKMARENERLENIVEERTSEVRKQRDEIHEKSIALESTLSQLEQAQNDLVRQEKMAMVGKLTKGLVDRVLNPVNYINNFSMLTFGFAKELKNNMEQVKDSMEEDVYEDSQDLFEMMQSNLQKISSHGSSVSRILKTMEEMLRERKIVFTSVDLKELLRIQAETFRNAYKTELLQHNIELFTEFSEGEVVIEAVTDLLGKAVNSMLVNSLYAVTKKAERTAGFSGQIIIHLEVPKGQMVRFSIRDNGLGIEASILPQLFDPYFTTKPTSEASGIGLYMTKDVIQSHGGTIDVESVKNQYTLFTVCIPVSQKLLKNE